MKAEQQHESLVDSLRLLAASADTQIDVLPNFVVVTDEIVSTFEDAFLLLPQLERRSMVSPEAAEAVRRVDAWLDEIPDDGSIADASTLATHEFWARGRELARRALISMNEKIVPPRLQGTTWVKGSA